MEKQIILSEKKVLEHNEKSFSDTAQLLSKAKEGDILNDIERVNNDDSYKEVLSRISLDKGRTIWIELKVEDSYLSSMIMSWMYSKSDFNGGDGLHALGCSLHQIMFEKPNGYSPEEKEAIKRLYDKVFGI